MGSERLPGKVLLDLTNGKKIIDFLFEQLKSSKLKKKIVAIPENNEDDILFEHLKNSKIPCFRGSSLDVLDRFYRCAKEFSFKHIMRITGDNPLIDPEIVKEHATSDDPWATKWMTRNIAGGSGPYKLVKHIPDQEVVFEAWNGYKGDKAKIKRMIWKIIPSPAQRALLLKSGVIDIAEGLGEEQFKSLKGAKGVKIITAPSGNLIYLGMNSSIPPFNDVLVRRAVSYAVDYNDILKNVYNGDAKRLWGPFSGTNSFSLGDKAGYRTDTAKGKKLLGSSSYKGEIVTISIDSSKADRELLAVRIQSSMRSIGMKAEIEKLTPAVYSERKVGKKLQMTIDGMNAWIDDPNYSLSLTLECGVYGNYMDYCNKEVDSIIKNGWAETNLEKRRAMFERAQKLIIDDAPWAFIAQPNFKLAMKKGLGGYVHYANEIPRYHHYYWE